MQKALMPYLVLQLAPKCFYSRSSLRSHAGMGSC